MMHRIRISNIMTSLMFILSTVQISIVTSNLSSESKQSPSVLSDVHQLEDTNKDKRKRELPKIQSTLIDVLKPVPVVDTIREEEKYGNTGDKFNRVGRGLVNGAETVANLINSALNFPMEAVKKLSRTATEALNNFGGKLVGLQ